MLPSFERSSGLLLHVTSLPSDHGIGDFGPSAQDFVDFLARAGQRCWQLLPLNPTDPFYGNSPYRSSSAFAISPLLAALEGLCSDGLVTRQELEPGRRLRPDAVDYPAVAAFKHHLLRDAGARFRAGPDYQAFRDRNSGWLDDYALFRALKNRHRGRAWQEWPGPLRDREPEALARARGDMAEDISYVGFEQYVLDRQWRVLRDRCRDRGILLVGDLPLYVDADSADAWAGRRFFRLDERGRPEFVAGTPPDRFNPDGQLWGNPVYDWPALAADGFDWWVRRAERLLGMFDVLRIDHFRGLVGYWQVPAAARTARRGEWQPGAADGLLETLRVRLGNLPFIAEDLGYITPDVELVRRRYRLPGMKVLLRAFGSDDSPHLPRHVDPDSVAYTGTHDNNTCRGWFEQDATPAEKARLECLLGSPGDAATVADRLVRACLDSPARLAVVPVQDALGLGASARMNRPGTRRGNWQWRLAPGCLDPELADRLRSLAAATGRARLP